MSTKQKVSELLLSTDTLTAYGLDLIFTIAKKAGFDGIDLATRKSFDAWNPEYVNKLSQKYNLPVKVVQTSGNINKKEINKALDLCQELNCDIICINAPKLFDYKAFNFIKDHIIEYKSSNKDIRFSIINPSDATFFAVPIPKYRFTNIVEIIKKYGCYLGLDVANLDEDSLEDELLRKLDKFLSYVSVIYLSDKTKLGKGHKIPGEGVLKLPKFLKKTKKLGYKNPFSIKLELSKQVLSDHEKVDLILKKTVNYYKENFVDIKF